jgi:vitamin K-dependent gamma-carboxylase
MYWHFAALGLLAAMIAAGLCYRASAALFCLGFTYVALLDKTQYLNHFYLVALISFLLIFVPANRAWSLDAWLWPRIARADVPAWSLWLLRFQIAIPYVYGGIAKLNGDWLAGQPMQMWMGRMSAVRAYVPAFGELWLALAFSYGGLLLDLLVVPLLLWRKTRTIAFCFAVVFHLTNAVLFQIGIFPWLMIAATTLFFEPDWPRRVVDLLWPARRSRRNKGNNKVPTSGRGESQRGLAHDRRAEEQRTLTTGQGFRGQGFILALLGLYVAIQILVPLRHWLYPGDVAWTEEGTYFSWRMMLSDKASAVQFLALDRTSGQVTEIDPRRYLIPHQLDRMTRDPEMLREFASFLKREQDSIREIHVVALCSLNGRKPQPLVDPKIDLGAEPRRFGPQPYIVPLTEPRRTVPWNLPPSDWPGHVAIPTIR